VGGHVTEAAVRPKFGEATHGKRKLHRRIKPAQFFFNFDIINLYFPKKLEKVV
jgi:hypothetical protein